MVSSPETIEAQQYTRLRVAETIRSIVSSKPEHPVDAAIAIPRSDAFKEIGAGSYSEPVQEVRATLESRFKSDINDRASFTHGAGIRIDGAETRISPFETSDITELKKLLEAQINRIRGIVPEEKLVELGLDNTIRALEAAQQELKVAQQLIDAPESVTDLPERASSYRRLGEIGAEQAKLGIEQNLPPKRNVHAALPEALEKERQYHIHHLDADGRVADGSVLPYIEADVRTHPLMADPQIRQAYDAILSNPKLNGVEGLDERYKLVLAQRLGQLPEDVRQQVIGEISELAAIAEKPGDVLDIADSEVKKALRIRIAPETLEKLAEQVGGAATESGTTVIDALKVAARKITESAAAIIPVVGIGAGAASAATNAAEGRWGDAAMDAAGMIPVVGDAVDLAQIGMAVGEFVQSVGGPTPEQARFNAIYNAIPPPNDNMDPELKRMAELKAQIVTAQTAFEEARLGPLMITENGSPDMLAMNNRRIATEKALKTAQDAFAMQYDAYQAAGKFGPSLQPSTRDADIAQDTSHDAKPDTAPAAPPATMTLASADIDAQIRELSAALAGIMVADRPAPFLENEGQATHRVPQSMTRTV